jgi:hypothetical protein
MNLLEESIFAFDVDTSDKNTTPQAVGTPQFVPISTLLRLVRVSAGGLKVRKRLPEYRRTMPKKGDVPAPPKNYDSQNPESVKAWDHWYETYKKTPKGDKVTYWELSKGVCEGCGKIRLRFEDYCWECFTDPSMYDDPYAY